MNRFLLSTLTATLLASASACALAGAPSPKSGIALENIDPAVRAQDDLFANLNGKWLLKTEIPADKSSWGTFAQLRDEVNPKLLAIIERATANQNAPAGS